MKKTNSPPSFFSGKIISSFTGREKRERERPVVSAGWSDLVLQLLERLALWRWSQLWPSQSVSQCIPESGPACRWRGREGTSELSCASVNHQHCKKHIIWVTWKPWHRRRESTTLVCWTMTEVSRNLLQKMHFSPAGCDDSVGPTDDADPLDSMIRWTTLLTGSMMTATVALGPPGMAGLSASQEKETNLTQSWLEWLQAKTVILTSTRINSSEKISVNLCFKRPSMQSLHYVKMPNIFYVIKVHS